MIRGFCPCFFKHRVVATNNQSRDLETDIIVAQTEISAPPLDASINLRDIREQMKMQSDEVLSRNEELYAKQLFRKNQLSQIKKTKYQGILEQMHQLIQFAEIYKKNRSTEAILKQAKHAELAALKKPRQEELLPSNTKKKRQI